MWTDRHTRLDDKLFLALLFIPAVFAGARYLESKSRMDEIMLQSKSPVAIVATASPPAQGLANGTSVAKTA